MATIELTDGRLAVVLYREDPAWAAAFTDPQGRLVDRPEHVGVRYRSDNIAATQSVRRPVDANLLPFCVIEYLSASVYPADSSEADEEGADGGDPNAREEHASHG